MDFTRKIRPYFLLIIPLVVFAILLQLSLIRAQASVGERQDRGEAVLLQATGTVEITPTPPPPYGYTEQELEAGRPIGIIIGAVILVLITFAGTAIFYTLGSGRSTT